MQYTTLELAQATGGGIKALQGTIRTEGDGASALAIESSDGVVFTVSLKSGAVYHCSPTGVAMVSPVQPAPAGKGKR